MPKDRSTLQQFVLYGVSAVIGGGFVGFALRRFEWNTRMVLHGALIGFSCYSMAFGSELLFRRWLEAKPEQWWRRALLYFAASQIGWLVGLFVGMPRIWGIMPQSITIPRTTVVVVRADGSVSAFEVPGPRMPLGLRRKISYEKGELTLQKGDALMLYSDGLPEAMTKGGEQIGYDGLAEIVRISGANVDRIMERIHAVEAGPRDDDQTVVMITRT